MTTTTGRSLVGPVATIVMLLVVSMTGGVSADEPEDRQTPSGFSDVPAGHVFEQEVVWLASTGIPQRRGDGSFGVADSVTRGAMAVFLYRYDQHLTHAADPQPESTPEPSPETAPGPESQPPATDAQQGQLVPYYETVFGDSQ